MTPQERAARTMEVFKQAAFDPQAVADIQNVMAGAIAAAEADMRERCAKAAEQGDEAGGSTAGIAAFIRALK